MPHKPPVTGTSHLLNFRDIDPETFERLCFWLVEAKGFTETEHLGAAGADDGEDITAVGSDGERVIFQCKRMSRFSYCHAKAEIEKLKANLEEGARRDLIFIVPARVSKKTRTKASELWGELGDCEFWAGTELDHQIKQHPRIVEEFFDLDSRKQKLTISDEEKQRQRNWSDMEQFGYYIICSVSAFGWSWLSLQAAWALKYGWIGVKTYEIAGLTIARSSFEIGSVLACLGLSLAIMLGAQRFREYPLSLILQFVPRTPAAESHALVSTAFLLTGWCSVILFAAIIGASPASTLFWCVQCVLFIGLVTAKRVSDLRPSPSHK